MDLTDARRIEGFAWMTLTRIFDEQMVSMWKQGRGLGGAFSGRGHEAIAVASAMATNPEDVIAPMHRDLGAYLVRGMTPERIFGNLLGRATGTTGGRDANLHGMGDLSLGIIGFISHLPQSIPVTLGAAMAFRYRKEPRAALTFVGDGGTTAGLFHEGLNMAALYRAPFVLVIENNQYAYSTPLDQQMASPDIIERVAPYGLATAVVEGNDFEAVYTAVDTALDRAREGGGPTVIEAKTMRMLGHAIHDGAEYVPRELLAEWEQKDPLVRYRQELTQRGLLDEAREGVIVDKAKALVADAVAAAEAAPFPDPSTIHDGVWA